MRVAIIGKTRCGQLMGEFVRGCIALEWEVVHIPLGYLYAQRGREIIASLREFLCAYQPSMVIWTNIACTRIGTVVNPDELLSRECVRVWFTFDDPQQIMWHPDFVRFFASRMNIVATCCWTRQVYDFYKSVNPDLTVLFLPPPAPIFDLHKDKVEHPRPIAMYITNWYEDKKFTGVNRKEVWKIVLRHRHKYGATEIYGPESLKNNADFDIGYKGYLPYQQLPKLNGCVVINTHCVDNPGYLNARFFECFAIGAIQVTEDKPVIHKLLSPELERDSHGHYYGVLHLVSNPNPENFAYTALAACWLPSIKTDLAKRFGVIRWLQSLARKESWLSERDLL